MSAHIGGTTDSLNVILVWCDVCGYEGEFTDRARAAAVLQQHDLCAEQATAEGGYDS